MNTPLRLRTFLGPVALAFASAATLLTGCAGFTSAPSNVDPVQSLHMTGTVHGGQQPIAGAKVYLYYVGLVNGGASTSLLTTSGGEVTTDANGNFNITGDYACPSFNTALSTYLLATGGNPGLAAGTNNTAIALIAPLGPCSGLTATTEIVVNELSTVAAVTALQEFMTSATAIAAGMNSSQPGYSAVQNIPNAMLVANNLVNQQSGLAVASPGTSSGISPQAKVNTLGNILAACVNSLSAASVPCAGLFTAATPTGGTAPTNTTVAMLNIAKNPGMNVSTLFALATATSPFQPALTAAPNDYTLAITYNGGGLSAPGPIAIDNAGDAWIANCPSCSGVAGTDSVVAFEPSGTIITTPTTYQTNVHKPLAIAIDRYNGVWVAEGANSTLGAQVTRLSNTDGTIEYPIGNNSATPTIGFPVSLSGTPGGMALVENGPASAFITDRDNARLQLINYDGTPIGAVNTPSGFTHPSGLNADGLQNLYIATDSSNILKYSPVSSNGTPISTGTFSSLSGAAAGVAEPVSIALDGGDHLFTYSAGSKAVSELFAFNGTAKSGTTGYTTGGIGTVAQGVIVDGAGTAWVANCRASCPLNTSVHPDNIIHLSAAGVAVGPTDGIQDSNLDNPTYTAIDISGNFWVSNTTGGTVTEFIGIASPVVTELETASSRNALGVTKDYLLNPSFELGIPPANPTDWTYTSSASDPAGTAKADTGAFSGQQKLTFYSGSTTQVMNATESQTITGLPTGSYLVSCYVAGIPGSTTETGSITAVTSGTTYSALGYTGTVGSSTSILNYNFSPLSVLVPVSTGTLVINLNAVDSDITSGFQYFGFDACSVTAE